MGDGERLVQAKPNKDSFKERATLVVTLNQHNVKTRNARIRRLLKRKRNCNL